MLISAGMHDGSLSSPCVVWLQDWVQISDSAAESDGWCGCLLVTAACHHRYPAADRETGSEGPRGGGEGERMEFMVIHRFGGGAAARIIGGGASGDKRREFGAARRLPRRVRPRRRRPTSLAWCFVSGGPRRAPLSSTSRSQRSGTGAGSRSSLARNRRRRVVHPLLRRGILRVGGGE